LWKLRRRLFRFATTIKLSWSSYHERKSMSNPTILSVDLYSNGG
jgi:hypothetical protein